MKGRAGRDEVRGEEEGNRRGEERVPAYHSSVIIYYRNYLSIYAIYSIDFINLLLISFYPKDFFSLSFFIFIFMFLVLVPLLPSSLRYPSFVEPFKKKKPKKLIMMMDRREKK